MGKRRVLRNRASALFTERGGSVLMSSQGITQMFEVSSYDDDSFKVTLPTAEDVNEMTGIDIQLIEECVKNQVFAENNHWFLSKL